MNSALIAAVKRNYDILLLLLVFAIGAALRPALPVDETRYLTVAWEMWFKNDWIQLSYNFEPYHHKPPLLFWLINISWSVFGVSRAAALVPVFIACVGVVLMTEKLSARLFGNKIPAERVRLMLIGSLPFMIYGSLLMFDMMMTAWTLGAVLCLLKFADTRKYIWVLVYGLCMGLGVLTKGPVIYIYTLLPALLSPFWLANGNKYRLLPAAFLGLLVSALPVSLWLAPLIRESNGDFLYWLLWKQTAGRMTGSFANVHGRSLFFYLPILPLFIVPWIFFPAFWQNIKKKTKKALGHDGFRFLLLWILPGVAVFSLITGKQPHYLMPFVPGIIIAVAYIMKDISKETLQKTVFILFAVFISAHAIASKFMLPRYDWRPIAAYVAANQDKDWAFVKNYNGEIGFFARMEHNMTNSNLEKLPKWFKKHPDGMAIIRYKKPEEVENYEPLYAMRYRSGRYYAGVFKLKNRAKKKK